MQETNNIINSSLSSQILWFPFRNVIKFTIYYSLEQFLML